MVEIFLEVQGPFEKAWIYRVKKQTNKKLRQIKQTATPSSTTTTTPTK